MHAFPKSGMKAFAEMIEAAGQPNPFANAEIGVPDEEITTVVDVKRYIDRKRAAFAAHVSQNDPNSFFMHLPPEMFEPAYGTEMYVLARGEPGAPLPESDVFAGVDRG
jgi:LmbE family N-acetylglucosaminyl deacetylase